MVQRGRTVAIIGGGPAGIAAAIWCKRLGWEPVLYEKAALGGQLLQMQLPLVDWPGNYGFSARQLLCQWTAHLQKMEIAVQIAEVVAYQAERERIVLGSGEEVDAQAVIYAPGLRPRRLAVDGAQWVRDQSTSDLVQDGTVHRVLIIGGGDRAVEAALRLSAQGKQVIVVQRSAVLRARQAWQEDLAHSAAQVYRSAQVRRIILQNDGSYRVRIEQPGGVFFDVQADCVLVRIGMEPDAHPGLYAGHPTDILPAQLPGGIAVIGDASTPACYRSLVQAVASGMRAAKDLTRFSGPI
ncbi:MAG: FAD-dependent oxidoreductase [Firmicutes bacterium]|nr:FAD-dependent oxidoreductase [Bacillota bacterium]